MISVGIDKTNINKIYNTTAIPFGINCNINTGFLFYVLDV